LKERYYPKDLGVDGRIESELVLGKLAFGLWSGYSWLRIESNGGLL
jgi:hypothetical protein